MCNRLVVILAYLLMLGCDPTYANSADDDLQMWTPVTLDVPLRRKLHGYLEINPRIGNNASRMNQLLIRPALEYRFNEHFSFFSGYLFLTNYEPRVLHENRIWQQILLDKDIKRLSIINRTRLEQRFFSNLSQTGNRLRHMLKLEYDLHKRVYAATSNELFVNLNSVRDGPQAGIDQNRFFIGLGCRVYKQNRIEIGYQYQYVNRTDPFDDQANQAIVIQSFMGLKD